MLYTLPLLICSGAPFHSESETPAAECPICSEKLNDHERKPLYGIRGFNPDEHDAVIPRAFFTIPPAALDDESPAMDALRVRTRALAGAIGLCLHVSSSNSCHWSAMALPIRRPSMTCGHHIPDYKSSQTMTATRGFSCDSA